MTPSPARTDAPPDALELLDAKGSAERALTTALAAFQHQVQAVPSFDLAAVVDAARPAFAAGLAFSAQLIDIRGRHKLRVTLMHAAGAEVSSEEWADEVDDLPQAAGWMLAMLLGIPLIQQAQAVEPEVSGPEVDDPEVDEPEAGELVESPAAVCPEVAAGPEPAQAPAAAAPLSDLEATLEPLTPEQIETIHQRILTLPQASRRELTTAFREHFQVPRNARSIGDRITQQQHAAFIDRFLEECQEPLLESAQVPAEP